MHHGLFYAPINAKPHPPNRGRVGICHRGVAKDSLRGRNIWIIPTNPLVCTLGKLQIM